MASWRVIYVDDESDIREVASMALELDAALEVRTCAGGQEALEVARSWKPNLILLDVMMPGMDGPMTLEELRRGRDHAEYSGGLHYSENPGARC